MPNKDPTMSTDLRDSLLKALQPAPVQHSESLLEWKPFPAAPVVHLIKVFDERVAVVNQKAANDRQPALAFLAATTPAYLDRATKDNPSSIEALESRVASFDLRAVQHPSISAKSLSTTTEFLADRLYQTYPLYDCEWMRSESVEERRYRMAKFVKWSDWNRQPEPAVSLRVNYSKLKTQGKGFKSANLDEAQRRVSELDKETGFLELLNYKGDVLRFERREQLTAAVNGTPISADDRKATAEAFLRGRLSVAR
jgi:hypothetical protein